MDVSENVGSLGELISRLDQKDLNEIRLQEEIRARDRVISEQKKYISDLRDEIKGLKGEKV
jgi:cell division protein FtsL